VDVVYERCCRLDIHKKTVVACVISLGPNRKTQKAIRTFGTMTDDLLALAEHPDLALPTHRDAVALKAWVRSRFGELTDELARTTPVDARGRAA
jgi:hypothetical protein